MADRNLFEQFAEYNSDSGSDFVVSESEQSSSSDEEDSPQLPIFTPRSRQRRNRSPQPGFSGDPDPVSSDSDTDSDDNSDRSRPSTSTRSVVDDNGIDFVNDRANWVQVEEEEEVNEINFRVRGEVGPTAVPDDLVEPIDFFSLFLSPGLMMEIVRQTNLYARQFLSRDHIIAHMERHKHSRYHKWTDVTVRDIEKYFALIFQMGIVKKKVLNSYWSTDPGSETPFFGKTMPLWKFLLIRRMLHLNDNQREAGRNEPGFDPWAKVRLVLDHMNAAFKRYYRPSSNISIDESIVGMKNRTVFIQYLKNKRHARFGIKKFELCDVNGYVMHVALYAGKDFDLRCREGQAHAVVIELMQAAQLLNKGFHLFTDRFYTRPALAIDLFKKNTLLTGTVMANAKGMPQGINAKIAVGEAVNKRKGPILVVAFREKKVRVFLLWS